jgi:hypothetical protein
MMLTMGVHVGCGNGSEMGIVVSTLDFISSDEKPAHCSKLENGNCCSSNLLVLLLNQEERSTRQFETSKRPSNYQP